MRGFGIGILTCTLVALWDGPLMAESVPGDGDWLRTLTGLDSSGLAAPLRALAIVTVLGVVPSVVLLTTCFPRVVIVLSFLRRLVLAYLFFAGTAKLADSTALAIQLYLLSQFLDVEV